MKKISKYFKEICVLFFTIAFAFVSIITFSVRIETNSDNSLAKKYDGNTSKIADPSTANNYLNVLGDAEHDGGRYAGRVWTDKTVFQNGLENVDDIIDSNISLGTNEDFLIAFSALGSSRILNGESNTPIDLVLVIDTSSSMGRVDSTSSNSYKTIAATNELINTLMSLNENNRVSIVLFDYDAVVLAPLAHYNKTADKEYITATGTDQYHKDYYLNYEENGENKTLHQYRTSGTNLQHGIALGYDQLLSAKKEDLIVNQDGRTYNRLPSLIILSDGESNRGYNNNDWWNPVDESGYHSSGNNTSVIRSIKPLFTAAYMNEAATQHYNNKKPLVYTIGVGLNEIRAKIALNPSTYVVSDPSSLNLNDHDRDIVNTVYSKWQEYKTNGTTTITGLSESDGKTTYTFNKPTTGIDINTLNYVNKYYDISSASELGNLFSNIVEEISSVAFHPVSDVTGTSSELDLTYTDPIGEYMDVKDVKGITLFGSMYKPLPNPEVTTEGNIKTTTYKFEATEIRHPSYVNAVTVDISKISIKVVEDENGNVTMNIGVPEGVIPLLLETVTTDQDRNITYKSNRTEKDSFPLRVFYSVGIKDNIKTDTNNDGILDTIDLSKVSTEYKEKNTNSDGTVSFYSNLYTNNNEHGDAKVVFRPSLQNRYYYFQKNRIIYSNPNGKEGVISTSTPSSDYIPVTDKELVDDENYYLVIDFYRPIYDDKGESTGKGEYVNYVVERTGAELKNSVTYYNPETNETSNTPSEGYVVATSIGGVRLGRLNRFTENKSENKTNTAKEAYLPTYVESSSTQEFDVFLGNNGELRTSGGSLTLSKEVKGERASLTKAWNFVISLTNEEGEKLVGTYNYIKTSGENQEVGTITIDDENDGNISLISGESVTIYNIPNGTKYEIVEAEADKFGYVTTSTNEIGTINNDEAISKFTNTISAGDLSITKETEGNGVEDRTWNFEINLKDSEGNGISSVYNYTKGSESGTINFINGIGTVSLKSGESIKIENIIAGSTYTVKEIEENADGYKTEYENATNTIVDNQESRATIINIRNITDLSLTKEVTGTGGDVSREWTFIVDLGNTEREYTYISSDENRPEGTVRSGGTITIKHGETITIKGIEAGTNYKVTEKEANQDGYTTTSENDSSTISITGENKVVFKNHKDFGNLTISKNVTGNGAETDRSFRFKVTFTDDNKTYNYTKTNTENGTTTATIKSGDEFSLTAKDTITIEGLELGTEYKVEELDANKYGYTTDSTIKEGLISLQTEEEFTNTRTVEDLKISKTVTGNGGEKDKYFTFQVELENTEREYTYTSTDSTRTGTIRNGGTITVKHGEVITINGIETGTAYTVTEVEANQDGYTTTKTGDTGIITSENNIAAFTNNKEVGNLEISKEVTGNAGDKEKDWTFQVTLKDTTKSYSYTGSKEGTIKSGENITLKHGEKITIEGIEKGTEYEVVELESNEAGYTTTSNNAAGIIGTSTSLVEFTNHKDLGTLTVTKKVSGNGAETNREFEFRVTFENDNNSYDFVTSAGKTGTIKSGDTFKLLADENIAIKGIPLETKYEVVELDADKYGYITKSTNSNGSIEIENETVFTNTRNVGDLTITKNVTGNGGEKEKYFTFQVELENTEREYTYTSSDTTRANGTIRNGGTITVKHGEIITIEGIEIGTNYKVTEVEADQDGYTTTKTGDNGAIASGSNRVVFTNNKEVGNLEISKEVTGNAGETDRDWTFVITFENDNKVYDYEKSTGEKDKITSGDRFTLKHNETITIKNVLKGTIYTVTEEEANKDGYITTSNNETGTIGTPTSVATFTNHKDLGTLTVTKKVSGNGAETNREFEFRVTFENDNNSYDFVTSAGKPGTIKSGDTFKLLADENIAIKGIPLETKYEVVEIDANKYGYTTESSASTGSMGISNSIVFTNTRKVGDLTITKNVTGNGGEVNKYFTFQVDLGNTEREYAYTSTDSTKSGVIRSGETVTIKDKETITIKNIEIGTNYKVTEKEADQDGYTTTKTGDTGAIASGINKVVFTNNKEVGSITISKTVKGNGGEVNKYFTFQVTLTGTTKSYSYTGSKEGTIKSGDKITLKDGESITISGIEKGTEYEVIELESNQNGYKTSSKNEKGTIGTSDIKVGFTNTKEIGSLTISKEVAGNAGDTTRDWNFVVILEGTTEEYNYTGSKEGKVKSGDTITLKHGESITIKELPKGTDYKVTELEADQDGYKTSYSKESGTIGEDEIVSKFINKREVGSLKISKVVAGNAGDTTRDWNFKITLSSDKEFEYTGSKSGKVKNGDIITLKDGEYIVINNIDSNTKYSITELEANKDGYVTTYNTNGGTITNSEISSVFTNTRNEGKLTISKKVVGNVEDQNKEWHFTVSLKDENGVPLTSEFNYTGSKTGKIKNGDVITLKSNEQITIEGLLEGTNYSVTESEANKDGYVTTEHDATGNINDSTKHAEFINQKDLGALIITKKVTGNSGQLEKEWHFTVTLTDEEGNTLEDEYSYTGSKTGTLKSGDTITLKSGKTISINSLPAKTNYTVVEREANQFGYTTTVENNVGTIEAESNATVSFINDKDLPLGKLSVTKTVTGIGDKEAEWSFRIDIKDEYGNIPNSSFKYSGASEGFLRSGDTIILKHGETITIEGLKEGSTYKVTEIGANENGYTTTSTGATGTIAGNMTRNADFINHIEPPKRGNLTISKTVTGTGGELDRTWTFVVVFAESNETYTYTKSNNQTGSIKSGDQFTLKHGESITINDIIVDTEYSVIELEANQDGYKTATVNSNGKIKETTTPVSFINNRDFGSLTISKTVTGNGGDKNKYFSFQVNFKDSDKVYNYTGSKTGTIKNGDIIKLKDGESITIVGILKDTEYSVTELEANEDGYITKETNSTGKITSQNTDVSFVNKREVGSLTISKIVAGNGGDKNREWTFKASFSNPNRIYHYIGSKEGTIKSGDTITLRHGESITIIDIEKDTKYEVTELEANKNNYHTTVTNNEGVIGTEEINVTFTNTREVGSLTISKTVTGELGELDRDWTFVITLKDREGNEITDEYHYIGSKEGTVRSGGTITLKHGESITIYDLDENIIYQVVELEANQEAYETTSTNDTGVIKVNEEIEVEFINHNTEGTGKTEPNPGTGASISNIAWPIAFIYSIIGIIAESIYLRKKNNI